MKKTEWYQKLWRDKLGKLSAHGDAGSAWKQLSQVLDRQMPVSGHAGGYKPTSIAHKLLSFTKFLLPATVIAGTGVFLFVRPQHDKQLKKPKQQQTILKQAIKKPEQAAYQLNDSLFMAGNKDSTGSPGIASSTATTIEGAPIPGIVAATVKGSVPAIHPHGSANTVSHGVPYVTSKKVTDYPEADHSDKTISLFSLKQQQAGNAGIPEIYYKYNTRVSDSSLFSLTAPFQTLDQLLQQDYMGTKETGMVHDSLYRRNPSANNYIDRLAKGRKNKGKNSWISTKPLKSKPVRNIRVKDTAQTMPSAFNFGLEAGLHSAGVSPNYYAGVWGTYMLNNKWLLSAGARFYNNQAITGQISFKSYYPRDSINIVVADHRKINTIAIPVGVEYNLSNRISLHVAPQLGFVLKQTFSNSQLKAISSYKDTLGHSNSIDSSLRISHINKINISVTAGVRIRLNDRIFLDGSFFRNLTPVTVTTALGNYRQHYQSFQAGVVFKLKK